MTVLATEYAIASDGGGRIDAIGLDARNRPAIAEFEHSASGTAIRQGLDYLDRLLANREVFAMLVVERLGPA